MGLFDKPTNAQDYSLKELVGMPIHITGFSLREVDTMYGPGTVIELSLDVNGEAKIAAGFSAGIKRQMEDSSPEEFPVWATIENKPLRGGKSTLILTPSDEGAAGQLTIDNDDDIPF